MLQALIFLAHRWSMTKSPRNEIKIKPFTTPILCKIKQIYYIAFCNLQKQIKVTLFLQTIDHIHLYQARFPHTEPEGCWNILWNWFANTTRGSPSSFCSWGQTGTSEVVQGSANNFWAGYKWEQAWYLKPHMFSDYHTVPEPDPECEKSSIRSRSVCPLVLRLGSSIRWATSWRR